jgi:hypothetical protein
MKKFINKLLITVITTPLIIACVEEQVDKRYIGPTVAEFKNYYLEKQSRMGTSNFQATFPNVVTIENTSLLKLTVRQPSRALTGTISTATNSTIVTGTGTLFTSELVVGSIIKNSSGAIVGYVSVITSDISLTLTSNALIALTSQNYRASIVAAGGLVYSDSMLVQLVGRQAPTDIKVTYQVGNTPEGAQPAVEGVHYNFVRNNAGEIKIKGNSSSGYVYINVLDGLGATEPDRVTLIVTLTNNGDIGPSENYKTFTYNIIK